MIDRDEAVRLAEQATLGSLLYLPQAVDDVGRWLRSGDFADPWHAQVYRLIREHHAAGHPLDATALGSEMLRELGPRRANLVGVHDLLAAAPTRPDPAVYSRMVLDAGLRREIAGLGVLLRAGALQSAQTGGPAPVVNSSALVDAALNSCSARWAQAIGNPGPADETPVRLRPALHNADLRLGADKYLRVHPARDPAAEQEHEAALVGALIAHPAAIGEVARWLPPGHISAPAWRTVYTATVELAELGQPVDLATVAWATGRLSHHDQPAPAFAELREAVDNGRLIDPRPAAAAVAGDQLRRIADNGAHQLMLGADNPGLLVSDLVDTGHLVTTALRSIAQELPHSARQANRPALAVVRTLEPVPSAAGR